MLEVLVVGLVGLVLFLLLLMIPVVGAFVAAGAAAFLGGGPLVILCVFLFVLFVGCAR